MAFKPINWKAVWDWTKRVGGIAITAVLVPYVNAKYGAGWGTVVGVAGAGALHQARRFGKNTNIPPLGVKPEP